MTPCECEPWMLREGSIAADCPRHDARPNAGSGAGTCEPKCHAYGLGCMCSAAELRAEVCRDAARISARNVEAVGLLNDLVTAKRLRLDAEEWQLVWDRVFRFLDATSVTPPGESR